MRVACPECAAEYDLPPALASRLDGVRTVRCARCGATWAPLPKAEIPPPEPPPATSTAAAPEEGLTAFPAFPTIEAPSPTPPAPSPPPPARKAVPVLAWSASILLIAIAVAAAWHWRVDVVEAWPPAARAYLWWMETLG